MYNLYLLLKGRWKENEKSVANLLRLLYTCILRNIISSFPLERFVPFKQTTTTLQTNFKTYQIDKNFLPKGGINSCIRRKPAS